MSAYTCAGPSINECLQSGLLYVDSTAANMVLRLPKQLLVGLYRSTRLPTYGQLDHGFDSLQGNRLEELCSGASHFCASSRTAMFLRGFLRIISHVAL